MAKRIDIHVKARDDASAQLDRIGGGVDRLTGKLDNLRNITIAGVGLVQLNKYLQGSLDAFGKFETASNRLNYSLGMLGKNGSAPAMQAFAKSITEVSAVSDTAALKIMAMGAATGKLSDDALKKATVAAIGLSKAYGTDLEQSMKTIIEASRGQTSGLRNLGVEIEKNAGSQKAFNVALDEGVKHFRAATGEIDTYEGKMAQLRNRMEMTRRELGERLAPVVMKMADVILDYGIPAMDNYGKVWGAATATVEAEALQMRDIINHLFKDEAPAAVEAFAARTKQALADAMKINMPALPAMPALPDMPDFGAALGIIGGAASKPSGRRAAGRHQFDGVRFVAPMAGAGAPVRDAGYDPTGGGGGMFGTNPISRKATREVRNAFGPALGRIHNISANSLPYLGVGLAAALTGGLVVGGGAAKLIAGGTLLNAGVDAGIEAATGIEPGVVGSTVAGAGAGTKAGIRSVMSGLSATDLIRAAITGNAPAVSTAGALGSVARFAKTATIGGAVWGAGSYAINRMLMNGYRGESPFVPPIGELANMRAALGTLPAAGMLPDQWAPDTKVAMGRADQAWAGLRGIFADGKARREQFLAGLNDFGPQQAPGGGMGGGWIDPIGGREFRFGGSNAGRRSADNEVVGAVREQTYQQKKAEELKARNNRVWARQKALQIFKAQPAFKQNRGPL